LNAPTIVKIILTAGGEERAWISTRRGKGEGTLVESWRLMLLSYRRAKEGGTRVGVVEG